MPGKGGYYSRQKELGVSGSGGAGTSTWRNELLLQLSGRLRERPTSVDWLVCCVYFRQVRIFVQVNVAGVSGGAGAEGLLLGGGLFTASTSRGIGFGGIFLTMSVKVYHISSAVLSDLCVLSPHMCTSSS
jgi:hypothetical protein